MNRKRVITVLGLALSSGSLASYLSLRTMSQTSTEASSPASALTIVVAARALAPGAKIQAADVRQIRWEADTPPTGTFARAEEVVGRVVTIALGPNELVLASLLAGEGSEGGLQGLIPAGMRAISVPVDEVVGVNGFMGPGARVDVIATLDLAGGTGGALSRAVLQDVEVIASGHELQADPNGAPKPASVATLLVTPEQAEALVLATHKGRIQLVMRGSTDRATVPTPGVQTGALTRTTPPVQPQRPAPSAAPTVRPTRVAARAEPRSPRIMIMAADGTGRSVVRY